MFYKLKIPFEKPNTQKGKSYFKGTFYIYMDEAEIIDIDVKFDKVDFDCMSTPSHWEKNSPWWKLKNEWLQENNIVHIPRLNKQNKIINLNEEQLLSLSIKINTWTNSRKQKISIKQIDSIISGSNSPGEIKNPKASAFMIQDHEFKNFATAITLLWNKNRQISSKEKSWSKYIDLYQYFELFPQIKKIFDAFQTTNSQQEYSVIKSYIKNELTQYKKFTTKINKIVSQKRSVFQKSMATIFPLISKEKSTHYLEKAHIKPVAHIKREIFQNWKEYIDKKVKLSKKLSDISNPENGLFLKHDDHRDFDNGNAYIDDNLIFINTRLDGKPTQLSNVYNTKERMEYIKYHKNKVYKKGGI